MLRELEDEKREMLDPASQRKTEKYCFALAKDGRAPQQNIKREKLKKAE